MAKLHGRAKAAFLARMARGRKGGGKRKHRSHARRGKRRNPLIARHDISRGEHLHRSMFERVARNPGMLMPTALVVNPEGGRSMARRHRKHRRHRRNVIVTTNPRRKHRRRHRRNQLLQNPRHRRYRRNALVLSNPAGLIKELIGTGIPAVAGGAVVSYVDGKFLGDKSSIVRTAGKAAVALIGGIALRKFRPAAAAAFMAGALGTIGGDIGARMAGGLPAIPAKKATKAGLAEMAAEDEQIGQLLQGMGIVVQGMGEEGIDGDEMAPGMGAYTHSDPAAYGDMEIEGPGN